MIVRTIAGYLLAVLTTHLLGASVQALFVIDAQRAMGHPVPFSDQLAWIGHDIVGLAPLYPAIIAVGFAIAFVAAGFVAKLAPSLRWLVFMVAGATALVAAFLIMKATLGTVGVFGARGLWGMAAQGLAGALGGLVFHWIKPSAHREI